MQKNIRNTSLMLVVLIAAGCAAAEDEGLSEDELALMTPAEVEEYYGGEVDDVVDGDDLPEAQALSCYATPWLSDLGTSIRFRSYGRCNTNVYALSVAYLATRNGYYLANPASTCGSTYQCYSAYRYFSDPAGSQQWCNAATTMSYASAGSRQVKWPQNTLCRSY